MRWLTRSCPRGTSPGNGSVDKRRGSVVSLGRGRCTLHSRTRQRLLPVGEQLHKTRILLQAFAQAKVEQNNIRFVQLSRVKLPRGWGECRLISGKKEPPLLGRLFFCALGAAGAENGKRAALGWGGAFWCAVLGPTWELRPTVHGCIKIIAQFGPLVKALPVPPGL